MSEDKTYNVDLTTHELHSLLECLTNLRKFIDAEHQQGALARRKEPIQDPVFVAACKLQYKLVKVKNPDTEVTLQDYLNYGNYGLNN